MPFIIDRTAVYDGMQNGTYWVRGGAFTSSGPFKGSLKVSSREACHIVGMFKGDLTVLDGATVSIHGMFKGEITVAKGGTLVLMRTAMFKGKIASAGTVVDYGALITPK